MNKKDSSAKSHPLSKVAAVPELAVAALKSHWIETAEEVLTRAATEQGRQGIKKLLSFDDQQLDQLLGTLEREVGPEKAERLKSRMPGGPIGVVLTPEQKQRSGAQGSEPDAER